jgi:CHAD domain-containing protein
VHCLDQYRGKLLGSTNRELRAIVESPEEGSIHRFRVGVKRLTAFYRLLAAFDPEIDSKQILRPARKLSSSISKVRDIHITLNLFSELEGLDTADVDLLKRALQARCAEEYRAFQQLVAGGVPVPLRMPTVRSLGLTESTVLRHKAEVLQQSKQKIFDDKRRLDARRWHDKRILLKRYHHSLDAFSNCPGHGQDEKELMQMKMLEQLLGDWHDRVIAVDILQSLPRLQARAEGTIAALQRQEHALLASSRIYLARFALGRATD